MKGQTYTHSQDFPDSDRFHSHNPSTSDRCVSYEAPEEKEVNNNFNRDNRDISQESGSEIVKRVFSKFSAGKSIFRDKNILSPEFIPNEILHREKEIEKLTQMMAPVLKGYSPSNIFVYGSVGTGKTITSRFVLKELTRIIKKDHRTHVVYINCKMKRVSDTEYRMLAQMLREFGVSVPDTGLSTNVLHRKLGDALSGKNTIVVLDEVDTLIQKVGDGFLYNMTRMTENISLIGITNNLTWHNGLDARVKSSLAEEEIIFAKYNAVQLYDILNIRAKEAFAVPVSDAVIQKCAALAAQEHGDARRAITLMKTAGDMAEREGCSIIEEYHVDMAEAKMNNDKIVEALKGQPWHSQAVFASIMEMYRRITASNGKWRDSRILSGDVYTRYREICGKAGTRELTQRRVCDLIKEIESLGLVETNVVSQGRYGRKTEIRMHIENSMMPKVERVMAEAGFG